MDIVGLFVPLMKVSVLLFSISMLFLILNSINEIGNVHGKVVKKKK